MVQNMFRLKWIGMLFLVLSSILLVMPVLATATITDISPSYMELVTTSDNVVISGEGFTPGAQFWVSCGAIIIQAEGESTSADGKTITGSLTIPPDAYVGNYGVYVQNPGESTVSKANAFTIGVIAPGDKIVFMARERKDPPETEYYQIYMVDPDSSEVIQLTNDNFDHVRPYISPNGMKIAYECNKSGFFEIYTMNADGSNPQQLTDFQSWAGGPSWSPDSKKIVFNSLKDGFFQFYVMDADGSDVVQITDETGQHLDNALPRWSPDGTKIAFRHHELAKYQIFVMNTDGSDQTQLSDDMDACDLDPSWSPDGTKIVFASYCIGNQQDIYVMNADGSQRTNLTNSENCGESMPTWSPDGTHIAFTSRCAVHDNMDIYVMNSDGTEKTLTLDNDLGNFWLSWGSPPDTLPPRVVSSVPPDSAMRVPVNLGAITITFNEPIKWLPNGKNRFYIWEWHGEDPELGPVSVEGANGQNLIMRNPGIYPEWFKRWSSDGGNYLVDVSQVQDLAGNVMSASSINFHTIPLDTTSPDITSTYPSNSAENVPPDVTITATIDEIVDLETGKAVLKDSHNNIVELKLPNGNPSQYGFTSDDVNFDDGYTLTIGPVHPDLTKGETYSVTLTGLVDIWYNVMPDYSWSFTVGACPIAQAGPDQTVILSENVGFDGTGSTDSDGTIVSYSWDFGDASADSGPTLTHAYTTIGEKIVTLTVADNDGLTGTDTALVTVITSSDAAEDLDTKVKNLDLPSDIEKGLTDKLTLAQMQITQGKVTPARNTLQAFINQVKAQSGKALTSIQADNLVTDAQEIINSIPGK